MNQQKLMTKKKLTKKLNRVNDVIEMLQVAKKILEDNINDNVTPEKRLVSLDIKLHNI